MNFELATVGNLQVDNVVAANGKVGLRFAGGNGGYSAVGARLWVQHCLLIASMPENFPHKWLDDLEANGVSCKGVWAVPGLNPRTSEWFFYREDGNRRDLLFAAPEDLVEFGFNFPGGLEVELQLSPHERERLEAAVQVTGAGRADPALAVEPSERVKQIVNAGKGVRGVHLAPGSFQVQMGAVSQLAAQNKIILLDPGHYGKTLEPHQPQELLRNVTLFAPSEREVYEFLGQCELREAARAFAAMGPQIVVIKIGAQGALLYDRKSDALVHVPAFPSQALDPTGCGDAFCGGMLAGYLETGDALQAVLWGTIAASFTVEGFGMTYPLSFTRADAEQRLAEFRTKVALA